jgi:hypothetical protein
MGAERRKYPRLVQPLDGSWTGASGASICRIGDISWGGCFINSLAEPRIGERTTVTVPVGAAIVTVAGTVVHLDKPMGFSVQFDELSTEQIEALRPLLGPKD